jgi:DNA-directed RNA polymerase specialized sigma24 family protein
MYGNMEDAGEVAHESLISTARSLCEFRRDSSLSSWLYAIARRFCTKKRAYGVGAAWEPSAPQAHPSVRCRSEEVMLVPQVADRKLAQFAYLRASSELRIMFFVVGFVRSQPCFGHGGYADPRRTAP